MNRFQPFNHGNQRGNKPKPIQKMYWYCNQKTKVESISSNEKINKINNSSQSVSISISTHNDTLVLTRHDSREFLTIPRAVLKKSFSNYRWLNFDFNYTNIETLYHRLHIHLMVYTAFVIDVIVLINSPIVQWLMCSRGTNHFHFKENLMNISVNNQEASVQYSHLTVWINDEITWWRERKYPQAS